MKPLPLKKDPVKEIEAAVEVAVDFRCSNCGVLIGRREGDTLIAPGFDTTFKRTHTIKCRKCRGSTKFSIDRNGEKVYKLG